MRVIPAAIVMFVLLSLLSASYAQPVQPATVSKLIHDGYEIKAVADKGIIFLQKQSSAYVCYPDFNKVYSVEIIRSASCFAISE
jgi:hypothetical protein